MIAHAYVDGFALYYMCYRGARNAEHAHLKWLDMRALAEALLPSDEVALVRYFTARVGDSSDDPQRASRQDVFIRALNSRPNLEVCEGLFHRNKREVVLAHPIAGVDPRQVAWVRQEKGSDVSLATSLLLDAFDQRFDVALLLTNDSDYVHPVRIVRERFNRRVIVISPDTHVSKRLAKAASHARPLDRRLLAQCQLPEVVLDKDGREIRRPAAWSLPAGEENA